MIEETDREAGELAVILNKADQASPDDLLEILEFTRRTITSAVRRPVPHVFTISALERLMTGEGALRRPIVEIEQRAERLQRALTDIDRAVIELRFRFDAAEADLATQFERRRTHFVDRTPHLKQILMAWIEAPEGSGRSLRAEAFEEARRLATAAIQEWFDTVEPEATRLYRATTERFIDAANEQIARVSADRGRAGTPHRRSNTRLW